MDSPVLTILCLTGMGGAILGLTGPIIAVLALTSGFTAWENCRSGLLQMQLLQPPEAAAGQQQT